MESLFSLPPVATAFLPNATEFFPVAIDPCPRARDPVPISKPASSPTLLIVIFTTLGCASCANVGDVKMAARANAKVVFFIIINSRKKKTLRLNSKRVRVLKNKKPPRQAVR